jgi:enoyl-[acyl-carrier protein] reductase I
MEVLDLTGKKGLVVGIANKHSLAWWAAQHFRCAGADLAVTYLSDKAKPHIEPLACWAKTPIFLPCDVNIPGHAGKESTRHIAAAYGDTQARRLKCESD